MWAQPADVCVHALVQQLLNKEQVSTGDEIPAQGGTGHTRDLGLTVYKMEITKVHKMM